MRSLGIKSNNIIKLTTSLQHVTIREQTQIEVKIGEREYCVEMTT